MKYRTKAIVLLMAMVFLTTGISVGSSIGILIVCCGIKWAVRYSASRPPLPHFSTPIFTRGSLPRAMRNQTPTLPCETRSVAARRQSPGRLLHQVRLHPDCGSPQSRLSAVRRRFGRGSREVLAIGEAYRSKLTNPFNIEQYQYDKVFTKDDWGEFLTANAPIKDAQGKVIAAVGMDVESHLVKRRTATILQVALTALGASLLTALAVAIILANRVSRPLYELRRTVEAIGKGDLTARTRVHSKDEFGMVGQAINSMAEGLQERRTLLSSIERYVPYQVVDSILHSPESPTLRGERRKLTVLVSDLRGFCSIAESRQPEEVVAFLNRCCEVMSEVIERHGGTLDKFIGDGMMATFGSPNDDPYQEERAVRAALDLQEKISELSAKCEEESWPAINAGIGIHSGYAVVGSMGSTKHMEYTAIGETVNTAHYLESATKQFRASIVISQYTYNAIRGQFNVKPLGQVNVKGHSEPMVVYSVESLREMAGVKAQDE